MKPAPVITLTPGQVVWLVVAACVFGGAVTSVGSLVGTLLSRRLAPAPAAPSCAPDTAAPVGVARPFLVAAPETLQ